MFSAIAFGDVDIIKLFDHVVSAGGGALLFLVALIILYYSVFVVQNGRITSLEEEVEKITRKYEGCEKARAKQILVIADLRSENSRLRLRNEFLLKKWEARKQQ